MSKVKKVDTIPTGHWGSFHGCTIWATPNQLIEVLGEPSFIENTGEDKVNMEWLLKVDDTYFTVYDWKEYEPLDMDCHYSWHVGTQSKFQSAGAAKAVRALLTC